MRIDTKKELLFYIKKKNGDFSTIFFFTNLVLTIQFINTKKKKIAKSVGWFSSDDLQYIRQLTFIYIDIYGD